MIQIIRGMKIITKSSCSLKIKIVLLKINSFILFVNLNQVLKLKKVLLKKIFKLNHFTIAKINISLVQFDKLLNKNILSNTFYCIKSEIYINYAYLCDEIYDCPFEEDEKNCSNYHIIYFLCHSIAQRIGFLQVCDNSADCLDGSDENFCGKMIKLRYIINHKIS